MAWDPIDEATLIPGKNVLTHMRQAWNCLKWLYGNIGSIISTGVQNNSFEVDSDGTGAPDNWTFAAYPGGSLAVDTTSPADGASAIKITHPGGAGNGGGTLTSDYITCGELRQMFLGFIHWASAAGMKNRVNIRFYTKAKVFISSTTVYDCTANPTTPTYIVAGFTPPATARYYKVELVGGYTDTNVAGNAYFDGLGDVGIGIFNSLPFEFTVAEVTSPSLTYVDVATITIHCPLLGLPVILSFSAELKVSGGVGGYMRFRYGSTYSNEFSSPSAIYVTGNFTLQAQIAAGSVTLYMQLRNDTPSVLTFGRKTVSAARARLDYANMP